MSDTMKRYREFRQNADKFQREYDRALGQQDQLVEQMGQEFGFTSLKVARKRLAEMEKGLATDDEALDKLMRIFMDDFGEKLEVDG